MRVRDAEGATLAAVVRPRSRLLPYLEQEALAKLIDLQQHPKRFHVAARRLLKFAWRLPLPKRNQRPQSADSDADILPA